MNSKPTNSTPKPSDSYQMAASSRDPENLLRPLEDRSVDPESLKGVLLISLQKSQAAQDVATPTSPSISEGPDLGAIQQEEHKSLSVSVSHTWHFDI